jgi:hypothetical protein
MKTKVFKKISNLVKGLILGVFSISQILGVITFADFIDDNSSGTFTGTFNNTQYSGDSIVLNSTGLSNGSGEYTSDIKNATTIATWDAISWTPKGPYFKNIPANNNSETNTNISSDAHITFDETSGASSFADTRGALTATCSSCPLSGQVGQFSNAVDFDGVDDVINIADSPLLNEGTYNNRTIMMWFRADATGGRQVIYEEGGSTRGFNVYLEGTSLYVGGWNNSEYGWPGTWHTTTITQGQWYHVALRLQNGNDLLEANKFKAYLNGIEYGSGNGGRMYPHNDDIGIGGMAGSTLMHDSATTGDFFAGAVDEFVVFDAALNLTQINEYYTTNDLAPSTGGVYDEDNFANSANVISLEMEENTGSTSFTDSSGSGQTSSCSGSQCPSFEEEGVVKNAVRFDGADDRIDITNANNLNTSSFTQRTISLWFKADDLTGNQMIFESGGGTRGFNIYLNGSTLYAGAWNNAEYGWPGTWHATTVTANEWYHIVLKLDNAGSSLEADKLKAYINGVEYGSGDGGQVNGHSGNIRIANNGNTRSHNGNGSFDNFAGYIDEFAMFNSSLLDQEILHLYKRAALSLKFQVRSCNDAACAGEDFEGPSGTSSYYYDNIDLNLPNHTLSLTDNPYFQYKVFFETLSSSYSPALKDVRIEYTPSDIPFLSFNIRNSDDTADQKLCNIELASTTTVENCSYRLKVNTNATNGYAIYAQTSGDLSTGSNNIQNADPGSGGGGGSDISGGTAGVERYGVFINPGSITSGSISLENLFDGGSNNVQYNHTSSQQILTATGPNSPAGTDTTNTSLVTHNLNIAADTPPGIYTQSITYTVVPEF